LFELSPWALGGFVAGEGTFVNSPLRVNYRDGTVRRRFVFQVTVAARDRAMLEALREQLGFGSIQTKPPGRQQLAAHVRLHGELASSALPRNHSVHGALPAPVGEARAVRTLA
jgi:hypothetical protein